MYEAACDRRYWANEKVEEAEEARQHGEAEAAGIALRPAEPIDLDAIPGQAPAEHRSARRERNSLSGDRDSVPSAQAVISNSVRLTHAAEKGASTPVLRKLSGHMSIRSLAKSMSDEGLLNLQADTDPAARRHGRRSGE